MKNNRSTFRSKVNQVKGQEERELKMPETIKLAPILSRNAKNLTSFTVGERKMSFINNSCQSQVSLSLKYKLEEMEKTKEQFLTEIGMQKKRIHKTVFK